ncbi:MAG TPA: bifunctional diguanylate cyclase/phosphodiesterase [Solirubrobacteraceae bacterium]|nr:bifunctional diguanylate cyclase/phosphodiesterase [Solirubrobacteraceae bacterium]
MKPGVPETYESHRSDSLAANPAGSPSTAPGAGTSWLSGRVRVALIGALIVLVGVAGSAFIAIEWRASVIDSNNKSFHSTATDATNALRSELTTNIGLTRTLRARAAMGTQDGESGFLLWYRELQRGAPASPHVVATLIERVPASGLPAFRRQAEADPAFRSVVSSKFKVVPPGNRPVYCLTRAIVGSAGGAGLYPGMLDYCAPTAAGPSPYLGLVRTATDTGTFIVTPLPASGGHSLVAIGAAVYRRGASIATVDARRTALTGLIGTTFDGTALIRTVVGARSLTIALYHQDIGGPVQLIARVDGNAKDSSRGLSDRTSLGEGWLIDVGGTAGRGVSANLQGLIGLGFGLLVTALALLLYRVLSRSRQRAWGLVGEKTDELEYRALHDPLTGLPNRMLVLDRAEQILARARRLDVPVTALFMDIDGFKQINDRFGHQVGDEVLRKVGARLQAVLRDSDTVGRLGGDEFVMLVDTVGLDAGPELVAERILDVLRQPIELAAPAQSPVSVTASIGVATGRPSSAEALLQDADLAMYKAKAVGKDGYALFESAMQTAAQDRIHLEMDLAEALQADQLFLAYQPMLDLKDKRVVGVEALLRWRHPTRGVIPPDAFIPIAEDSGLIVPIGRWVLEQACLQAAAWHTNGYPVDVSINVSARQLERTEFVEEVRAALRASDLDASTLTLEITETVLMRKPDATAHLLGELKQLGVRIAVDDFGTGYSSLAYLRQFPVDSLKIDRTFIGGLAHSGEAHALTHTLIQLGKALGLQTLAEGVEEQIQAHQLRNEGCDLAQGFLFARPLTPDAVESFLDVNSESSAVVRAVPSSVSAP